ncbi:hypothetical protein JGK43_002445 [Edwardsiella piscicida]|nr:hypothetical protein [Edwardsiella piscicida]ELM3730554.1 hypothetical protein [Edwardsiella piscicida]ELV7537994.1 hypothetical protein [Edwardsiella piscicida]
MLMLQGPPTDTRQFLPDIRARFPYGAAGSALSPHMQLSMGLIINSWLLLVNNQWLIFGVFYLIACFLGIKKPAHGRFLWLGVGGGGYKSITE